MSSPVVRCPDCMLDDTGCGCVPGESSEEFAERCGPLPGPVPRLWRALVTLEADVEVYFVTETDEPPGRCALADAAREEAREAYYDASVCTPTLIVRASQLSGWARAHPYSYDGEHDRSCTAVLEEYLSRRTEACTPLGEQTRLPGIGGADMPKRGEVTDKDF